jgi:hypothetical protein
MSLITTLKYHGRGIVLPVDEIKQIAKTLFEKCSVTEVLDFGAGTLFWSEFFADDLNLNVTAVDTYFINNPPDKQHPRITIGTDIRDVLKAMNDSGNAESDRKAIFICDVVHHLPPELWREILPQITALFDVVVIKDIDCNRKFGNFANRMHDRIINGVKIYDVCPDNINAELQKAGFTTKTKAMPKLWYPHFIIAGGKK